MLSVISLRSVIVEQLDSLRGEFVAHMLGYRRTTVDLSCMSAWGSELEGGQTSALKFLMASTSFALLLYSYGPGQRVINEPDRTHLNEQGNRNEEVGPCSECCFQNTGGRRWCRRTITRGEEGYDKASCSLVIGESREKTVEKNAHRAHQAVQTEEVYMLL